MINRILFAFVFTFLASSAVVAHEIVHIVKQVKPSIVGVGVQSPTARPRSVIQGTGFSIGDGYHIATNFHVVEKPLAEDGLQKRVIFIGSGENPKIVEFDIVATDPAHDLAILKVKTKVPPLLVSNIENIDDGTEVAFTGFPIGAILGLYPATHKGIIAATTPVALPAVNAQELSIQMMKRLKEPFFVYQMDATAYPGNSGSPVYELDSGKVIAIINKVFVKTTKEAVLSDPSDISYSIPVKYLRMLARTISLDL